MKTIGTYMAIFGLLAIVLNFFNAVPRLLAWIYNWGDGVAWGIKIAFVIIGAILYFMGRKQEENIAN
ncbi:hypothetical protein [Empedobacter tilapiae]|uniref:DUF378 domain-containing protein n=1 Tax=Empedobacter tilapiae TaxID=2491114 RepID=A0A4Z1B710_9FLAO|nr:hypothetical protein [Empedobacter tilapiae]TGN29730.1 hypothetical protein E4J94_03260 [Empedobacter tilapiae]